MGPQRAARSQRADSVAWSSVAWSSVAWSSAARQPVRLLRGRWSRGNDDADFGVGCPLRNNLAAGGGRQRFQDVGTDGLAQIANAAVAKQKHGAGTAGAAVRIGTGLNPVAGVASILWTAPRLEIPGRFTGQNCIGDSVRQVSVSGPSVFAKQVAVAGVMAQGVTGVSFVSSTPGRWKSLICIWNGFTFSGAFQGTLKLT